MTINRGENIGFTSFLRLSSALGSDSFSEHFNNLKKSMCIEELPFECSEFLICGPIILFLARINRGGWPKWIEKIALKWKLVVPVSALD